VALLRDSRRDDAEAPRRACTLLEAAISRSPSARPLYHFRLADASASARDRDRVERVVDDMLYLWPRSALAWCCAGKSLAEVDPTRAESCVRKALELDPALSGAWNYLGLALRVQGRLGDAAQAFAKAVAANPRNVTAWINLGVVQLGEERAGDAAASLRRAVELDPDRPGTHYNLGCALFALAEADAALHEFERTVELAPDYRPAWTNLYEMHKAAGRGEAQVATLRAATGHNPQWADAFFWLGSALEELGRRDEALPALRRYVELRPDDEAMRAWLARNDKKGK
jgi:tetratricopeptide (TPR) repeat protein